jgi:hypothetical protein
MNRTMHPDTANLALRAGRAMSCIPARGAFVAVSAGAGAAQ